MWIKDEKIMQKEKEIIQFIQEMEPTTYYHEPSCSLYIFSERISFSIKRNEEGTKYGARFVRSEEARGSMGRGYIHGKTLEEIEMKLKEKAREYYKNRIKWVLEGRNHTYLPKLFHFIYEKPLRQKMNFVTEIPKLELNKHIKEAFHNPTCIELTSKEMNEYMEILQNKNQKKKPERGIKMGNLKLFIYKDQLDILPLSKKDIQ